jgi:hypothetical protein
MDMSASTLSIAPSNGRGLQLTSIDDVMRFARIVVTSGLAPKSFDTPEKVVIALVTGMELGISAMQSLQGLAVTNGRIGVMGDLALALCQASPDFEDYQEEWLGTEGADDWGCRITAKRRNQTPKAGQFTVYDAKKARLWEKRGKDNQPTPWITYPQRMLRYRALGFVLRDAFPDVLKGVKTVEELQDYPEEKNGFHQARPVEGSVVDSEAKPPVDPSVAQLPDDNSHAEQELPPAVTLQGSVSGYEVKESGGKTYHAVTIGDAQATIGEPKLYTTDAEAGEVLKGLVGFRASVNAKPSRKPGLYQFVQVLDVEPPAPAADPERKVLENPGMDAAARKKAREVAKERLAKGGVQGPQATAAPAKPEIPMGDADWQRVTQLIAEGDTSEYWVLSGIQSLGWVGQEVKRLTDVRPKTLQEVINRWPAVLKAAQEKEAASPAAA